MTPGLILRVTAAGRSYLACPPANRPPHHCNKIDRGQNKGADEDRFVLRVLFIEKGGRQRICVLDHDEAKSDNSANRIRMRK